MRKSRGVGRFDPSSLVCCMYINSATGHKIPWIRSTNGCVGEISFPHGSSGPSAFGANHFYVTARVGVYPGHVIGESYHLLYVLWVLFVPHCSYFSCFSTKWATPSYSRVCVTISTWSNVPIIPARFLVGLFQRRIGLTARSQSCEGG